MGFEFYIKSWGRKELGVPSTWSAIMGVFQTDKKIWPYISCPPPPRWLKTVIRGCSKRPTQPLDINLMSALSQ